MCYEAIGNCGGRYIALDPVSTHIKYTRRDVLADWIIAITMFVGSVLFLITNFLLSIGEVLKMSTLSATRQV